MSIPLRRWRTTRLAAAGGGLLLLAWTLIPVYNMLLIALSDDGDEFTGAIWPDEMNLDSFRLIWSEGHWYLEHFWRQFSNSLLIGMATMLLTVLIGSLASFAMGRMRSRHAWTVGPIALLTYAVPASFLVIPFTRVTHAYGLVDSPWAVIAAHTTFATPFAILVFHQYGKLIPTELDDAARVDGATPWQMYWRVYLPLLMPAVIPSSVFALLVAWNDYLYQFLLLSSPRSMTVIAAIDQFFDSDEAPWNVMMAMAMVYTLPPLVLYVALQQRIVAGLSAGAGRQAPRRQDGRRAATSKLLTSRSMRWGR